jgi:hypothetical protein
MAWRAGAGAGGPDLAKAGSARTGAGKAAKLTASTAPAINIKRITASPFANSRPT